MSETHRDATRTGRRPRLRARALRGAVALGGLLLALAGCAYYNTFYMARKNFDQATEGELYPDERPSVSTAAPQYDKAITYSKALMTRYPKSKWVDDAYLLWARSVLGKGDPFQAADILDDFSQRFPKSGLQGDAAFFLAVAYRQGRKFDQAIATLDDYQSKYPKNQYAPYGWLERARVQFARRQHDEAAAAANVVMTRFSRRKDLTDKALRVRAQANFERGVYDSARVDFQTLGSKALNDDERLDFLLREAECLSKKGDTAGEIALLQDQLHHESIGDNGPSGLGPGAAPPIGYTPRRARVLLRLGGAYGRAGEYNKGMDALRTVLADYPKTAAAAEAQFRIGYFTEVYLQDFARARDEYGRVKDQLPSSEFIGQANQRAGNLDRLAKFAAESGDTLARAAEKAFVVAELTLYEMGQPEKALELFRGVAQDYPKTTQAAKAMNAQGWLLSRRLQRPAEGDSMFWQVVYHYPGTQEALDARDFLEYGGHRVPDSLIVMPAPSAADSARALASLADTTRALTQPPHTQLDLGGALHGHAPGDSLLRGPGPAPPFVARPDSLHAPARTDTTSHVPVVAPAPPDTTRHAPVSAPPPAAPPPDTTRRDTTRAGGAGP